MPLTVRQVGVPLASSGLHAKMIGFWIVIVLVVLLVIALLVWRARARKRSLQQGTDDRQQQAHTDAGKER
jgi:membrane protein implicated in regulation of membrane protease activity